MTEKTKISAEERLSLAASKLCGSDRLKSCSDILSYLKSVSEEAFKKGASMVCGEKNPEKGDADERD